MSETPTRETVVMLAAEFSPRYGQLRDTGERRYPREGEIYYYADGARGVTGPHVCEVWQLEGVGAPDSDATLRWSAAPERYAIYIAQASAPDPEPLRTALESANIRQIARETLAEMRRTGESHEMCSRWLTERISAAMYTAIAALSSSPAPVSPETWRWREYPDTAKMMTSCGHVEQLDMHPRLPIYKACIYCGKPLALPSSPTPQEKP